MERQLSMSSSVVALPVLSSTSQEHSPSKMSLGSRTTVSTATSASETQRKVSELWWFALCCGGITGSFAVNGALLEYCTKGKDRRLDEASFLFFTSAVGTLISFTAKTLAGEKQFSLSASSSLLLSVTSIMSTFTSVLSLRYVIYPVQVLAKSCKPVPVIIFGTALGKRYTLQKYLNVMASSIGFVLFMSRSLGEDSSHVNDEMSLLYYGVCMLLVSLCCDGMTGAYEDKVLSQEAVGPFTLMFSIQLGKMLLSLVYLLCTSRLSDLLLALSGTTNFLLLGTTGAVGQIFIYLTINKFGALNCALIGLGRKLLSLVLSFWLYGHPINLIQTAGLLLSVLAMAANVLEPGSMFPRSPRRRNSHSSVVEVDKPELDDRVTAEEI